MTNPYMRVLAAAAALGLVGIIVALIVPLVGAFLIGVGVLAGVAWLHAAATAWRPKDGA